MPVDVVFDFSGMNCRESCRECAIQRTGSGISAELAERLWNTLDHVFNSIFATSNRVDVWRDGGGDFVLSVGCSTFRLPHECVFRGDDAELELLPVDTVNDFVCFLSHLVQFLSAVGAEEGDVRGFTGSCERHEHPAVREVLEMGSPEGLYVRIGCAAVWLYIPPEAVGSDYLSHLVVLVLDGMSTEECGELTELLETEWSHRRQFTVGDDFSLMELGGSDLE